MLRPCSIALSALLSATALNALPTIALPGPAAAAPNGIVATADGTIYFVDAFRNTVWRVQRDGGITPFVRGRPGGSLHLDRAGNIYGTHVERHGRTVLWRADPCGAVSVPAHTRSLRQTHPLLADALGFPRGARNGPRIDAMARTRTGALIVTSGSTVSRIAADGTISMIADGGRLLAPRRRLLARLFGAPPPHLTGVAVADNGDIYIVNAARGAVVRVDRDGRMQDVPASERGWHASGVAAARGAVYVLEYGAGVRVRRLDAGSGRVIAHVNAAQPPAVDPPARRLPI
jgi:sugar lactone lactonase YvrE